MQFSDLQHSRRRFLSLTAGLTTATLLAGCGGGGSATPDPVAVVPAATGPAPAPPVVAQTVHPLNLLLNLAYIGAQYYGRAANDTGLAASLTGGVGQTGAAFGARRVTFGDSIIAAHAVELARDKQAHVVDLRGRIGDLAAAQPAIDLSTGARGAFSLAAQGAGIVAPGASFDPYASDDDFLLGAFLIENRVAAAYRTVLLQADDAVTTEIASDLADAIYHGGLIRALLDGKAASNAAIGKALTNATVLLSTLDGTNGTDQTQADVAGMSSNILDADGRAIPFTRASAQVLSTFYLSSGGPGGFLPAGANGVQT